MSSRAAGERTERKKSKKSMRRRMKGMLALLLAAAAVFAAYHVFLAEDVVEHMSGLAVPEWVDVQLIAVDGHSRSGVPLTDINDIVIHYVGNPGTSAQANRDYFDSDAAKVSSHFVVGLEGEIIQCIPLDERSAASNDRNPDTISIEVCHPDESGRFNDASYESLVRLTAWLCHETGLDAEHVIRHYDVTGKLCPKYFVDNEDAWEEFKTDVSDYM